MRRVVGLTLTGLGAFFLALALLLRFYVPSHAIKYPLNEYDVRTLTGDNMTYFSQKDLTDLGGVAMRATSTVEGDVAAGSPSTAVWQQFTALQDTSNNLPVRYETQRLAFDRRTGVLVNCCGSHVGNHTNLQLGGQGYVFPFNTQKRTYQVFDTTLLRPEPIRYAGTATVDGVTAYKFVEQVSNQQFGTQTLPGALVGVKNQASVTLPQYLTATNTVLVDPVTGAVLEIIQNQSVTLKDSTGATRLVLLQGKLASTPQTIQAEVNTSNSARVKIQLVQIIGPLVGLLLGLVLLIIGITLLLNEPDDEELIYEDDPEPATA